MSGFPRPVADQEAAFCSSFQLPVDLQDLPEITTLVIRKLEELYQDRSWPIEEYPAVTVLSQVWQGAGDVVSGRNLIERIARFHEGIKINWCVPISSKVISDPYETLPPELKGRVTMITPEEFQKIGKGDVLVAGPSHMGDDWSYIEKARGKGAAVIAVDELAFPSYGCGESLSKTLDKLSKFSDIFKEFFPAQSGKKENMSAMGLGEGQGVFLNQERIRESLFDVGCDPKYLKLLENKELQQSIFNALGGEDYSTASLAFGYAQIFSSKKEFVECAAMKEQEKNVVVVLNAKGEECPYTTPSEYSAHIFSDENLKFFEEMGYTSFVVKKGKEIVRISRGSGGREITVDLYDRFAKEDMKNLQLAAPMLLATGDNTLIESLCAGSTFLVYECRGHKRELLNQLIGLSSNISEDYTELLKTFGRERGVNDPNISQEERERLKTILQSEELPKAVAKLCKTVVANYSLDDKLKGQILRSVYNHLKPKESLEEEMAALGPEMKEALMAYVNEPGNYKVPIPGLEEMKERVETYIATHRPYKIEDTLVA